MKKKTTRQSRTSSHIVRHMVLGSALLGLGAASFFMMVGVAALGVEAQLAFTQSVAPAVETAAVIAGFVPPPGRAQ